MSQFLDLQVNGYAGADFNSDSLTFEQLHSACTQLRRDGVEQILATVITDHLPQMKQRLARLAQARHEDPLVEQVIRGVHIEGPFLNDKPGYIGAHPAQAARSADPDIMRQLFDATEGLVQMVTLAPECDPNFATTRWLSDQGVCVAAGHSNASYDQLAAAIDNGLRVFTHLGNGCPSQLNRHDNIIQRVLSLASDQRLKVSFIADGVHVPPFALKNYLRVAGIQQSLVVTDAIAAAGLGPGVYTLGQQQVEIGDDGIAWSEDRSHFVGSATTMPRMVNVLAEIGLQPAEIEWLTFNGPRSLLAR